jgi:hypothetical protein
MDFLEDPGGGLKNARGHFDLLRRWGGKGLYELRSPLVSGQDEKGYF